MGLVAEGEGRDPTKVAAPDALGRTWPCVAEAPALLAVARSPSGHLRLGRYELIEPLGAGGMAEVFKARCFGPGGFERHVVIKRIQREHGADPDFMRMFVEEAKILGMLHHANVVQVYEFGEDRGTLFLALEYVEGPSLSRVLRTLADSGRRMPAAVAAYVGREVCRALDYVHNLSGADGEPLGIIHRDVTPSNVMLTSAGAIKLLDFGVAKSGRSEGLTRAGTVKGKPAYLAPEQLDSARGGRGRGRAQPQPIDGRVDLFALGVVLHEMLSLQHLFAGERDLVTLKNIREMVIPRPSEQRPDVPPELDAVIMRALERDPDRRYPSAAEMARALDDVVVASRLHMDDVVGMVREIEAEAAAPARRTGARAGRRAAPPSRRDTDRTVRDVGMRVAIPIQHLWARARSRGAALAGVVLAVAALATAVGIRVATTVPRDPARLTRTADAERAADLGR
jgi:tRNA A-37 threonylcarbamoyl transferase component Bud32